MSGWVSDQMTPVQEAAFRRVQATWPQLDSWRSALRSQVVPGSGSELRGDDEDFPPLRVSDLAWQGLIAAADHLQAIRFVLDRPVEEPLNFFALAHLTLARSALVGAAQCVWLLAPADAAVRVERGRMAALEFHTQAKRWGEAQPASVRAKLPAIEAWNRLMRTRCDELKALRRAAGEREAFGTTAMIREAAREVFRDEELAAEVVSVWHQTSGSAHGWMWSAIGSSRAYEPTLEELQQPVEAAADARMVEHVAGGDPMPTCNAYLAAFRIASHGWMLYRKRAQ